MTEFYADTYPLWRNPGPWVSEAEAEAFFDQPIGQAEEEIVTRFSAELYWYLGPCAADALLEDVYYEAIAKAPIKLLFEIIKSIFHMLIQDPTSLVFPIQYLDQPEEIIWKGDGSFGFFNADSAAYNGHRIWRPGVHLYSSLLPLLQIAKLLTPIAIIAALREGDWLLTTVVTLIFMALFVIAVVASRQARFFAMLAPLYSILIGWFLAQLWARILASRSEA